MTTEVLPIGERLRLQSDDGTLFEQASAYACELWTGSMIARCFRPMRRSAALIAGIVSHWSGHMGNKLLITNRG